MSKTYSARHMPGAMHLVGYLSSSFGKNVSTTHTLTSPWPPPYTGHLIVKQAKTKCFGQGDLEALLLRPSSCRVRHTQINNLFLDAHSLYIILSSSLAFLLVTFSCFSSHHYLLPPHHMTHYHYSNPNPVNLHKIHHLPFPSSILQAFVEHS